VSEEVPVNRALFPSLIGPQGSRVQALAAKHGNMVIRFADADAGKDVVFLQGSAQHVAAAKADLLASIQSLTKNQVYAQCPVRAR
jgi:hypothetical protein